jgi:hypothetical protein
VRSVLRHCQDRLDIRSLALTDLEEEDYGDVEAGVRWRLGEHCDLVDDGQVARLLIDQWLNVGSELVRGVALDHVRSLAVAQLGRCPLPEQVLDESDFVFELSPRVEAHAPRLYVVHVVLPRKQRLETTKVPG